MNIEKLAENYALDMIEKLAESYALDMVFADRPFRDDDYERVMANDFDEYTPPPDGFMLCEQYNGYSASYIANTVRMEYHNLINFYNKAKTL